MDISNVVLELMQKQTNQEYILMDATNMNFKDRSFDFLLDKGTFDALIVRFN
jgi:ubiquinone/menaquinone biosynthesis C-methylase UbiE